MSWPLVTLEEVCEINVGRTPSRDESGYWDSGEHLWVSIGDMSRSRHITNTKQMFSERARRECGMKPVRAGTVLMSFKLSIGKIAFAESELYTNEAIAALPVKDPRQLDTKYLAYALEVLNFDGAGKRAVMGTTLNKASLKLIKIPLPPLTEQRRIAGILDQADALRRLRRQSLSRLSALGQAIFHEMFGEFLDAEAQGRTDLLGNFCNIQVGFPFKSGSYTESPEGIMLCRGANVLPNRLDWSDMARYPLDLAKPQMDFALQQDDVVIAMDRPWISSGFKAARIRASDLPSLLVQRVARLRGKETFDNQFIFDLVRSSKFQSYCKPTETTVPHISPVEIRNFSFIVPPEHARREYEKKVAFLDQKFFAMNEATLKSERLFASLQHRAFRGVI